MELSGPFWATDEWCYYNLKTNQFIDTDIEGFENLILVDIDTTNFSNSLNETEIKKEETTDDNGFDISAIEDNKSINKKRILNDLNQNIDENEIINSIKVSKEAFDNYKENFIGNKSNDVFNDDENKQKEYKENALRNFLVLENFILKADDKTTNQIYKYLSNISKTQYDLMYAKILSGMLNYYLPDTENIVFTKGRAVPAGGYEINLTINSNYVISYEYGDINNEEIGLIIYEGVSSFDDIYNNYDLYEDGENTYLSLKLMSYNFMDYFDYLMNNY